MPTFDHCRRCRSTDLVTDTGRNPHGKAAIRCGNCGSLIRWLSLREAMLDELPQPAKADQPVTAGAVPESDQVIAKHAE